MVFFSALGILTMVFLALVGGYVIAAALCDLYDL